MCKMVPGVLVSDGVSSRKVERSGRGGAAGAMGEFSYSGAWNAWLAQHQASKAQGDVEGAGCDVKGMGG